MKVIIIDDERLAREELKDLLKNYKEIDIVGEASNADEGLELIQKLKPELIFLDIHMPEKTGFDLLSEIDQPLKVVFITAYDEYAVKAFEVNAEDYILKPIDQEKLNDCLNKILNEHKEFEPDDLKQINKRKILSDDDYIFLKDGDKCFFIQLKEVILFQSEGNYVKVLFGDSKILILRSLNSLEEKLNVYSFFRANRKHIVNLKYVTNVETWFNGGLMLELDSDKHKIEVSRRQAIKFKDVFSL